MNFAPYEFTLVPGQDPPWHMDQRHIQILHRLAMLPGIRTAVEIGSYRGASTAAFIEAQNAGAPFDLVLHEIEPRPSLRRVVGIAADQSRVKIDTRPFWEGDAVPDLVLIDGDHQWPAVGDTLAALARGAGIIVMHDTAAAANGFRYCWGTALAAAELKRAPGRQWLEDAERRPGEWTHRGLLVSWDVTRFPSAVIEAAVLAP